MKCGVLACNRYADCHAKITANANKTSLACRCLPGFKGDGLLKCEPINQEGTNTNIIVNSFYLVDLFELILFS